VKNVDDKLIQNIIVSDDSGQEWNLPRSGGGLPGLHDKDFAEYAEASHLPDNAPALSSGFAALEGRAPTLRLYVPTLGHGYPSVLLSEHGGPYVAAGSRAAFGYSFLFTPMIPLFMAGDEFDATFHAIPWMSPNLYGGADPGKGTMAYGSMLDWNELNQPPHRSMFEDVKRMLSIRKQEVALLGIVPDAVEPRLIGIPHDSDIEVPVPYIRWSERAALIVLANRNTTSDAHLRLHIPLEKIGWPSRGQYRVTDVWRGGRAKVLPAKALADFSYQVKRDKTPRGGMGLLKIERVEQ
jgi:hypothetical protein